MTPMLPPLRMTASSVVSACGVGWSAHRDALRTGRVGLRANDFEPAQHLETWIGRVSAVEAERWDPSLAEFDCRSNRLLRLAIEEDGFAESVRIAVSRHGDARVGVFVGTTTSGMLSTELEYRAARERGTKPRFAPEHYSSRQSMYAVADFVQRYLRLRGACAVISTACSSGAKVFAMAQRAIGAGRCSAAVVAGVDSLSLSTLYGFRSLQLLSRRACRPFSADRDGISIGEGAGVALLEREGEAAVELVAAGETSDAFHMSLPPPHGEGAASAMREVIERAGSSIADIDYVNLHGTGTLANDAAEDAAMVDVFGPRTLASSTKGLTGHTLGASGAIEALFTVDALDRQWMPGTAGLQSRDPTLRANVQIAGRSASIRLAMSNSFGFGGSNCSLLFRRTDR